MSILVKPYEISIWRDEYDSNGVLQEKKLGIIGTHTMDAQCRALDPNLVRNVNGTKKFSFKMYSQYVDNMTGEKVYNPYIDWLVSERKVKLHYDGKWYDFIIKNISENSATHLYTYQLEDAWVQELSKNGFGMVLDNQLRNNMGTANELAARVLAETDWTVADDSEVIVQTVDEALVYVKLPDELADNIKIKHIIDQTDMTRGVGVEDVPASTLAGKVALAFYSSCTNKPHRFQFIYSDEGYGKDDDGKYLISRKEDRTIDEKDCQYYIDFDNPGTDYSSTAQGDLGLYLPNGWSEFTPTGEDGDVDSKLSSWYRGKRYGFAQQSEYIPVLDRYCNKYYVLDTQEDWDWETTELPYTIEGDLWKLTVPAKGHGMATNANNFKNNTEYILRFVFKNSDKKMTHMGGHNDSFEQLSLTLDGSIIETQYFDSFSVPTDGNEHIVELTFKKKDSLGPNPYLYIQPNRLQDSGYAFEVEITPTIFEKQEYYGYLDANYDSPALKQNLVSNTLFESTSGWTGTKLGGGKKATVTNVCGRFDGSNFISSLEDLENGEFQSNIQNYKTYLKMEFPSANSVVINSGPYDHRTLLNNIVEGDKFALFSKYGFLSDSSKKPAISVGEYKYQTGSDSYEKKVDQINFAKEGTETVTLTVDEKKITKIYDIYEALSSAYTPKDFKSSSQIRICVTPPADWDYTGSPYICYLEEIELFRAVKNGNTLITLDNQGSGLKDRVIDKTYHYYSASTLDGVTDKEELKPDYTSKTLTYETYKPVYNAGAEKVRSIAAKESNYFNILQSIAETFEAWLELDIERNDQSNPGKITGKKIRFKNYIGSDNYAGFRYGVNLKDIQRTYESKNLVTKLIVKQNSNELAKDGFCTIARAGANPTGENYIYDFQYFYNTGLLNAKDFFETAYVPIASGTESSGPEGYYPRIKDLNKQIQEKNELLVNTARDLVKYKADLESATAGLEAAVSAIEETREDFLSACGVKIDNISDVYFGDASIKAQGKTSKEDARTSKGAYCAALNKEDDDETITSLMNDVNLTYNRDQDDYILSFELLEMTEEEAKDFNNKSFSVYICPELTILSTETYKVSREYWVDCTITRKSERTQGGTKYILLAGSGKVKITHVDTSRYDLNRLINEYSVYSSKELAYASEKATAKDNVDQTQTIYDSLKEEIDELLEEKRLLNQLFFSKYSRFIQEGTWMSEEYVDDEKYYYDAQSVLYNSCYPQVAYSINVLELSSLPGYELFKFGLGDKTYAEDPEFFGSDLREEVIISEISEMLDDPSKNNIKVQNFKNQFQDLFQKITATVQQAQYSTGAYKKAVALAEANQATKQAFFTDALSGATARLTTAGQQEVDWGNDGITVYSKDNPSDAIRMVGGAILLSKKGEDGIQKWVTGVTSDGVSASLITAGTINAREISIMNRDQPTFRWDSYGISAYDSVWYDSEYGNVIGGINTEKFVRFDKHGIYGIDGKKQEGLATQNWIDANATFALTWEGLKVSGDEGVVARIGKDDENIISIIKNTDSENCSIFSVSNDGSLNVSGNITGSTITGGTVTGSTITGSTIKSIDGGESFTLSDQGSSIGGWTFTKDGLFSDYENNPVGLNTSTDLLGISLVDYTTQVPITFYSGLAQVEESNEIEIALTKKGNTSIYSARYQIQTDHKEIYDVKIKWKGWVAESRPSIENLVPTLTYDSSSQTITASLISDEQIDNPKIGIQYTLVYKSEDEYATKLLSDGSFYCQNVLLQGSVQASSGELGGFRFDEKGFSSQEDVKDSGVYISQEGISLSGSGAFLKIGGLSIRNLSGSSTIQSFDGQSSITFNKGTSVPAGLKIVFKGQPKYVVQISGISYRYQLWIEWSDQQTEKKNLELPLYIYSPPYEGETYANSLEIKKTLYLSADSTSRALELDGAKNTIPLHYLVSMKKLDNTQLCGLTPGEVNNSTNDYFEIDTSQDFKKEYTTPKVTQVASYINMSGDIRIEGQKINWDTFLKDYGVNLTN